MVLSFFLVPLGRNDARTKLDILRQPVLGLEVQEVLFDLRSTAIINSMNNIGERTRTRSVSLNATYYA